MVHIRSDCYARPREGGVTAKGGKPSKSRRGPRRPVEEAPPRKHVLLLSCMDQRLVDETLAFMNGLNLHNRYDHLIIAGAAMGCRHCTSGGTPWSAIFFDHLVAAIEPLERKIQDIFILEHLDCGAYGLDFCPHHEAYRALSTAEEFDGQRPYHQTEARAFADEIDVCAKRASTVPEYADAWRKVKSGVL